MKPWIFIIIILSLMGLWISDFLLDLHTAAFSGRNKNTLLMDLCTGTGTDTKSESPFDCRDVVLDQKWGYVSLPLPVLVNEMKRDKVQESSTEPYLEWIFYKIPLALLSLWYYFFLLAWFLFIGRPNPAWRKWHLVPLIASAGAVLSALFYIWVMATQTDSWCMLCLVLHGMNAVIFALTVLMWRDAKPLPSNAGLEHELPLRKVHVAATLAYAATLCAISVVYRHGETTSEILNRQVHQYKYKLEQIADDVDFLVNAFMGSPKITIPERKSQSSFGHPQAEHELIVFSDLQCPHCRKFEQQFLKEYLPLWQGGIKMTFRHFPLCCDCNKTQLKSKELPEGVHPQACTAAYALETANLLGGVESSRRMYDRIHESQDRLAEPGFLPNGLVRIAEEIGLDGKRFLEDMSSDLVRGRVGEDVNAAASLKVKATPTLFLDNRRLTPLQWGSTEFWKRIAALPPESK